MPKVKEVVKEPVFLYVDKPALKLAKDKEQIAVNLFENVKALCIQALAEAEINYFRLIEYGSEILVDAYFKAYVKSFPDHLNRNIKFQNDTDIKLSLVDASINEFKSVNASLREYALKVDTKGNLISGIIESDFNRFLNENKEKQYNAVKQYVEAIKQLENVFLTTEQPYIIAVNRGLTHIVRNGLSVEVKLTDFI